MVEVISMLEDTDSIIEKNSETIKQELINLLLRQIMGQRIIHFYNTAGSEELKSDYKKDVVEALTKSYKAFRYDYLTGLIALIIIIILFFNKDYFYNPYDHPIDTKGVYTFYLLLIINECPHVTKLAKFKLPSCPKAMFWNALCRI